MTRQYPHYLFIETAQGATMDANGEWAIPAAVRRLVSICREETNGGGSEVEADGSYRKFSATINMPRCIETIPDGAKVIVSDDAECTSVRISGVCLKHDHGQMHDRIWV